MGKCTSRHFFTIRTNYKGKEREKTRKDWEKGGGGGAKELFFRVSSPLLFIRIAIFFGPLPTMEVLALSCYSIIRIEKKKFLPIYLQARIHFMYIDLYASQTSDVFNIFKVSSNPLTCP